LLVTAGVVAQADSQHAFDGDQRVQVVAHDAAQGGRLGLVAAVGLDVQLGEAQFAVQGRLGLLGLSGGAEHQDCRSGGNGQEFHVSLGWSLVDSRLLLARRRSVESPPWSGQLSNGLSVVSARHVNIL
jgi:hypothetical protein